MFYVRGPHLLRKNYEDEVQIANTHHLRWGCRGGTVSSVEENVDRPEAQTNTFISYNPHLSNSEMHVFFFPDHFGRPQVVWLDGTEFKAHLSVGTLSSVVIW